MQNRNSSIGSLSPPVAPASTQRVPMIFLETSNPMACNIDQLPNDIISYIFSFLILRDAFRARLSLSRWLHLTDSHPVLQFDSLNVFGKEIKDKDKDSPALKSEFVKIVNCFMKIGVSKRIHKLAVNFRLGKEHVPHIDRWISTSVNLKVEELELNFSGVSQERYVFPCHLVHFEKSPYLKRLRLSFCTLHFCFRFRRMLVNLTTIGLSNVPLRKWGFNIILSACSNLISLHLFYCDLPKYMSIDGQLPCLKNLTIHDNLFEIKLNCPSLETFGCHGSTNSVVFVHVSVLREAKLWTMSYTERCPLLFNNVTTQAPRLQVLSLIMKVEVKPVLSMLARCLKELHVAIFGRLDLLTVTNMLNASPVLETLRIQLCMDTDNLTGIQKGEYHDRCHYNLKQVRIDRFLDKWNEMDLAIYLLKNALALEKMVIRGPRGDYRLKAKVRSLQQISPTVQVIFM